MTHRLPIGRAVILAVLLTVHATRLAAAHAGEDHVRGSSVETPWLVVAGVTVLALLVFSLVRRHNPALGEGGGLDDADS